MSRIYLICYSGKEGVSFFESLRGIGPKGKNSACHHTDDRQPHVRNLPANLLDGIWYIDGETPSKTRDRRPCGCNWRRPESICRFGL